MSKVYQALGISKQAFFQWKERLIAKHGLMCSVVHIINQVRKDHPGMGARTIWDHMKPPIGRDEFEYIALREGLGVQRKRNYQKTTDSSGVKRFDNLVTDLKLTGVNQVWVSDITYYLMVGSFSYLTFIMDLFSRKLIGYSVSRTLMAEDTTMPALHYAFKFRKGMPRFDEIIFHSDGGGQYYANLFLKMIDQYDMISSMGKTAYENPNVERLHATLKNQYIYRYNPKSYAELEKTTAKAFLMYNMKPHRSLGKLSPNEFEANWLKMTE